MTVERMDHQLEQLLDLRLKPKRLLSRALFTLRHCQISSQMLNSLAAPSWGLGTIIQVRTLSCVTSARYDAAMNRRPRSLSAVLRCVALLIVVATAVGADSNRK